MDQFKVTVEVRDAAGNVTFALSLPATKDDLIMPGHQSPGLNTVLAHLVKATKEI